MGICSIRKSKQESESSKFSDQRLSFKNLHLKYKPNKNTTFEFNNVFDVTLGRIVIVPKLKQINDSTLLIRRSQKGLSTRNLSNEK